MKNVLKMVYGNQKEVKLESQVIELSSLNELQSLIKELDSNFKTIEGFGSKLATSLADADRLKDVFKKEINNALMISSKANEKIKEFIKKGKELGVDISDLREINILKSKQKEASDYLKFYNSIGNIPNIK